MAASLLTINTVVPANDRPGTPVIVYYDTGDWEIAMAGDVDYIEESSKAFLGYETFIDFFVGLMIFFDLGTADDLDYDFNNSVTYLMISETVNTGSDEEPVLLIYQDGTSDVMFRAQAEGLVAAGDGFNFIPAVDLFEDFRTYRARHEDVMFAEGDEDEDIDEDADPEET